MTTGLSGEREVEKFDQVAQDYSQLHTQSVSASGESAEYFSHYKIACLKRLGLGKSRHVLDFGCGIGNLTRLLSEEWETVTGYDPSSGSIEQARSLGGQANYQGDYGQLPPDSYDLVIISGVLHHVPPDERSETMLKVLRLLSPGGTVVVFEHNPLNPLTRRAVDACPFDDDAILLPAREVKTLLKTAGLDRVKQDFIVFFPRLLSWFRPLEPGLAFCPLGAQTMTWGMRAGA